jgi:hypothetical protein
MKFNGSRRGSERVPVRNYLLGLVESGETRWPVFLDLVPDEVGDHVGSCWLRKPNGSRLMKLYEPMSTRHEWTG